jgi:subtilisin family serine protease
MKTTHFFSRFKIFALLVFCCFLVTTLKTLAAEAVEDEYIIKFRSCDVPTDSIDLIIGKPLKVFSAVDAKLVKLDTGRKRSQSELSQLSGHPCVEYVEPNYILTLENTELSREAPGLRKKPNDPDFLKDLLWGLDKIEAEKAWDIFTGHNEAVIIAIIDTGVDYKHPDIQPNMWINTKEIAGNGIDDDANDCIDDVYGCNFTEVVKYNEKGNPIYSGNIFNENGYNAHGTHIAGIIAAVGDNGVGIVGVNWSAKIMAIKIVSNGTNLSTSDAKSAIEYAQKMGAKIINSSWHINAEDSPKVLYDAIKLAKDAGILFVTAAGNQSSNIDPPLDNKYACLQCPASFDLDNIISVAATDRNDKLFSSNFGLNSVDIGAPGEEIYSTVPLSYSEIPYSFDSGTSMAAPYVVGVAALLWSLKPHLTYRQVKEIILSTVDPIDSLEGKTVTGGRLNAYKALIQVTDSTPSFRNNVPVALCKVFVDEFKVKLDATDSFGNIQRYNWIKSSNLDSDVGQTGAIIDFELKIAGTYTVKLSVTDHKGLTDETLCDFTVPQVPKPVQRTCMTKSTIQGTATSIYSDNSVPIQGAAPLTLQVRGPDDIEQCQPDSSLDSIDSIESMEPIVKYIWTVCKKAPDGTCISQTDFGDQKTFSRTFESSGTYEVEVTVKGKGGTVITPGFEVNVLPTLASISPTASFAGGVSINGEDYQTVLLLDSITDDVIDITGQIKVDSRHIGLLADILVVYIDPQTPEELYMLDNQGVPYLFEGVESLVFFQPNVRLETIQKVSIYNGPVQTNRWYFFGYFLKDYTLVHNSQPIEITMN